MKPGHLRALRISLFTASVIAILASSAAQAPSAVAAPLAQDRTAFGISVSAPPRPVCAGNTYPVTVTITQVYERYNRNTETWKPLSAPGVQGVTVEATSSDTGVGTISPPEKATGLSGDIHALGDVAFSFKAVKAGYTQLFFRAFVDNFGIDAKEQIKVVNCKYNIKMTAFDIYSGDGVAIWTSGTMSTQITGEGGNLKGTGSFAFNSGFVGPPCKASYSTYDNPTTITGKVDESEQLNLTFSYQPGFVRSTVTCPAGSGSNSQAVDLTNTGVTQATFPATGGTRVVRFQYKGSDMPPGTMIITVWPAEDKGG